MATVLIVEDDSTIRRGIKKWLELEGLDVLEAEDGQSAIDQFDKLKGSIDIIILDVMLPKLNGYEVLEYVRANQNRWDPVIMLTAKDEEDDKIYGLDSGADDYMTKPFSNRELVARIKSSLRMRDVDLKSDEKQEFPFEIDHRSYMLISGDKEEVLTKKESMLLTFLMNHKNNYVTKEEILDEVWAYKNLQETRTVDIHISKLRKKLKNIGCGDYLKTKHGVGYGLRDDQ
ncbi:response regulator transcription factor [Mollicutes bacterium LVI A0039]|nr:response regulator transcription factor [Mollicutes bacterium LVI A0039]